MLDRSMFSPLFTGKFFTIPSAIENSNIDVGFPLPTLTEPFRDFVSSRSGHAFRDGVTTLLEELRKWAISNDIDASPLASFCKKLNATTVTASSFDLFTDGIKKLKVIIDLIQASTVPHNVCVALIRDLIPSLQLCAPGAYKKIITVHAQLTADVHNELMLIRQTIAEQVVTLGIRNFNQAMQEYYAAASVRLKINEGDETHLASAVLNYFADDIKIRNIVDRLTRVTGDDLLYLIEFFKYKIYSSLTFAAVIDELLFKLNLDEFGAAMQAHPEQQGDLIKSFTAHLNQYGVDAEFNFLNLFDEDALANDEYRLAHDAESCLRISLMHRLANGGFVQLSLEAMIEQFISNLNLDDSFAAMQRPEERARPMFALLARLRCGTDWEFNFLNLFDEEALKNDEYRLADNALSSLRASLKQRFAKVALQSFTHADATVSVLPGHDISYSFVVTDEGRISLLSYCKQFLLADKSDFMELIKEQRDKALFMQSVSPREWKQFFYSLDYKSLCTCLRWMPKAKRTEYLMNLDTGYLNREITNGRHLHEILRLLPIRDRQHFLKKFSQNLSSKQALDCYSDDHRTYQKLHAAKIAKLLFFTTPVNNMRIYTRGKRLAENIRNLGKTIFVK